MMACALPVAQPAASRTIRQEEQPLRRPSATAAISQTFRQAKEPQCHCQVAQDSSESSESIVKYVTSSLSTTEDIFALAGIGFAAIAALWASVNLIESLSNYYQRYHLV